MLLLARSATYDTFLVQATAVTIVNYNCNVVIEQTTVDQSSLLKIVICKEVVKISDSYSFRKVSDKILNNQMFRSKEGNVSNIKVRFRQYIKV